MIRYTANFDEVTRGLTKAEQRQVPFAISLALNYTVEDIKANTEKGLGRRLDRPTPFTKRGLALKRASKRNLSAVVFFKDRQAEYLEKQEKGGTRRPKRKALAVPFSQRLNKYGNLPRRSIDRLLKRPDVFQGEINGVEGIWQRPRRGKRRNGSRGTKGSSGLKLLIAYEKSADYQPRLRFREGARKTADARIKHNFRRAMRKAILTAH
ncbi:hypothetical protein [Pseudovibrio sp. WM33]|uniref:hypothetical protein n=1 Tax=Pseudovibrio sp. WM33 TaxID=1735585 RepID=UPI0007AE4574|nr:hypothetical protein [Pseudovibrio sp. WM33]KZL26057.1 hypothetical protein PsWM33_01582 [Pseudovibrio sp. WM33]